MKLQRRISQRVFCTAIVSMAVLLVGGCSPPSSDDPGGGELSLWDRVTSFFGSEQPVVESEPEPPVPWSTPPGITLVDLMDEQSSSQPVYLATRLGTETGEPLYVPEGDDLSTWTCNQKCAENYEPLPAPPDAQASGAWSLAETVGERSQWMYHDKPLYRKIESAESGEAEPATREVPTHAEKSQPAEPAVVSAALAQSVDIPTAPSGEQPSGQNTVAENSIDGNAADGSSTVEAAVDEISVAENSTDDNPEPPGNAEMTAGLTVALYGLARHMKTPPTITVEDLPVAGGQALVTSNRMTIYFYTGDSRAQQHTCGEEPCFARWEPVEAPMMAHAIGDFAPVQQSNGVVQWTYAGKPLFTYREDFAPGQANGANQSEFWKIALLSRDYRPPDIVVAEVAGHGHYLATADGKPLYNRLPFRYRFGGRNSFEGYIHNLYEEGKELGTGGCDAECLKIWNPFPAPPGAQPNGYWEVFERPDGTTQWAYQGYALYTNARDQGPNDITATDLYEPLIGTNARYDLADGVAYNGVGKATGLNWHLAKP